MGAAKSPSSSSEAGGAAEVRPGARDAGRPAVSPGDVTLLFITLAGAVGVRSSPLSKSRISWKDMLLVISIVLFNSTY